MLSYNLTPIFQARGIQKPHAFLVKAGMSTRVASKILAHTTYSLSLAHIEILCTALVCEPNDIFTFTPNPNKQYAANHPLLKLAPAKNDDNLWQQAIFAMPFKQLKEAAKAILQNQE